MKGIEGKLCVVTGAAKSIGYEIVRRYVALGAKVVMIDIDPTIMDRANECIAQGEQVKGYILDITDQKAVLNTFAEFQREWGPVYTLVNVAGVVHQAPIEECTPKDWDFMMQVNVYGSFYCVQGVVAGMKAQKDGKIINFSSKSGKTGSALMIPYSSAKGAVIAMTQGLAFELADHNIKVNCICPGITDATGVWSSVSRGYTENLKMERDEVVKKFTAKIPLKRLTDKQDIVDIVEYLTRSGEYCTGQAFNVTGGREMH